MTGRRRLTVAGFVLAAAGLALPAGCGGSGPATYRVEGKVVFADGTPMTGGQVVFRAIGEHRVTARGAIRADGSFRLSTYRAGDGAVEGQHAALVAPPVPEGRLGDMKVFPQVIDRRFTRFETSGLKCTVTRDKTKNQFTLQVEPPRR